MMRLSLGLLVATMAILLIGAPGGLAQDKKDDKKKDEKGTTVKATVVKHDAKEDTITVKYKEKEKDVEKTIKLDDKMKLLNEGGKDVPVDEFLKNLEGGEAITIIMNAAGAVTEIRDIAEKKKEEKKKDAK
jgi:hypothetical protein